MNKRNLWLVVAVAAIVGFAFTACGGGGGGGGGGNKLTFETGADGEDIRDARVRSGRMYANWPVPTTNAHLTYFLAWMEDQASADDPSMDWGKWFHPNTVFGNDDVTVYARWTTNAVRPVVFNLNGAGTSAGAGAGTAASHRVEVGQPPRLPDDADVPTRTGNRPEGLTFAFWATVADGTTPFSGNVQAGSGDFELFAIWGHQVTWDLNFTESGADDHASVTGMPATAREWVRTNDAQLGALPNPSRAGQTFEGWFPVAAGTGTQATATTVVTGPITFYAKWEAGASTFTATMDWHGSTASTPTNFTDITAGGTIPSTDEPSTTWAGSGTGVEHAGWFTSHNGTGTAPDTHTFSNPFVFGTTAVNSAITIHAKWEVTITFDVNDANADGDATWDGSDVGDRTDTVTRLNGSAFADEPENDGSEDFKGWSLDAAGDASTIINLTTHSFTESVTLYAIWE